MSSIGGMSVGVGIGASLRGLDAAAARLDDAAGRIAGGGVSVVRGADPSPAPPTGDASLTAAQDSAGIEAAMVDVLQARRAYEANAKALEQQDTVQKRALQMGA